MKLFREEWDLHLKGNERLNKKMNELFKANMRTGELQSETKNIKTNQSNVRHFIVDTCLNLFNSNYTQFIIIT